MADEIAHKAEHARSLLGNQVFKEAFENVEIDIIADIANIKMLESEGGSIAVKLAMELQALQQVKIKLNKFIEDQLIHGDE